MLIASFGLLVLSGGRAAIDGGVKYVALNLVSTILFLTGIGLLYGMTGTLNLADLAAGRASEADQGLLDRRGDGLHGRLRRQGGAVPAVLLAARPPTTPPHFAVSALFAGLLTKVGVYALIRMFTLVFDHDTGFTHTILLWVAVLTMVTGVLGAAAQTDFRKILSFHIVSQIGYMVLGLALMTPLALVGAVFYLIHHIVVKANLFLIAGVGAADRGQHRAEADRRPLRHRAAAWPCCSSCPPSRSPGFPPLSGFWAKF